MEAVRNEETVREMVDQWIHDAQDKAKESGE